MYPKNFFKKGEIYMFMRKDSLLFGMMVGAVIGAVYATSNKQAQTMVQKGKAALKKQVQNL